MHFSCNSRFKSLLTFSYTLLPPKPILCSTWYEQNTSIYFELYICSLSPKIFLDSLVTKTNLTFCHTNFIYSRIFLQWKLCILSCTYLCLRYFKQEICILHWMNNLKSFTTYLATLKGSNLSTPVKYETLLVKNNKLVLKISNFLCKDF